MDIKAIHSQTNANLNFVLCSISYVIQHSQSNATNIVARDGAMYPHEDDNIDIYTTPMSLRPELLDYSYPVQALDKLR